MKYVALRFFGQWFHNWYYWWLERGLYSDWCQLSSIVCGIISEHSGFLKLMAYLALKLTPTWNMLHFCFGKWCHSGYYWWLHGLKVKHRLWNDISASLLHIIVDETNFWQIKQFSSQPFNRIAYCNCRDAPTCSLSDLSALWNLGILTRDSAFKLFKNLPS